MNRVLAVVLVLAGIALGILGFQKMNNSKTGIEIGNVEISAKSEKKSNAAIVYLALGAFCLVGGVVMLRQKNT